MKKMQNVVAIRFCRSHRSGELLMARANRIFVALFIVGSACYPASAVGQGRDVHIGVKARVSSGGRRAEGTVVELARDSVWLSRDEDRVGMPLRNADSVWTRQPNTVRGLTVGGTLGGLTMGALGAMMSSGLCEVNCSNAGTEGFIVGGLIGAGGGGLLGAIAGSLIRSWKRVAP